jgi:hypothetical protein
MKTLRLLNFAAFLLLFTPFFQMCSDSDGDSDFHLQQSLGADSTLAAADSAQITHVIDVPLSQVPAVSNKEQSTLEAFWELITVPGDNFTTTAFGLFVITAFDIAEGNLDEVWIGSVFIIVSLVITISSLIRLFKKKTRNLLNLILTNIGFIVAAYVAAMFKFDSISQVKWGFYLYLFVLVIFFLYARATLAKLEFLVKEANS